MQESYYCPPAGKHRNASGKLPDKIKNIKYQVKKKATGSWATFFLNLLLFQVELELLILQSLQVTIINQLLS